MQVKKKAKLSSLRYALFRNMSSKSRVDSTTRRQQILQSLAVTPLDAGQLVRLSTTFCAPFTDRLYVLRAMARIVRDGFALEFVYPDKSKYWRPSKEGYRLLHGPERSLPKKTAFKPISPSLERHTRRLADLMVATPNLCLSGRLCDHGNARRSPSQV